MTRLPGESAAAFLIDVDAEPAIIDVRRALSRALVKVTYTTSVLVALADEAREAGDVEAEAILRRAADAMAAHEVEQ